MPKDAETKDSSTLRALGVLELIARADAPLSLLELTQQSELPKPSVFRIIGLLQRGRLVQREPSGKRYGIGARLSQLALDVMMHSPQRSRRHAILKELVEEIGETCNYTMQDGNEVVYLDRVETSSPVRLLMDAGSRVPMHCTASGKLFLSQLTERKIVALLGQGPYRRYTDRTITEPIALQKELRRIRSESVGTDVGEYLEGSVCLAVPILARQGHMCATIAVHGPSPRLSLKKAIGFLPALRRAAKSMAATMDSAMITDKSSIASSAAIVDPIPKLD